AMKAMLSLVAAAAMAAPPSAQADEIGIGPLFVLNQTCFSSTVDRRYTLACDEGSRPPRTLAGGGVVFEYEHGRLGLRAAPTFAPKGFVHVHRGHSPLHVDYLEVPMQLKLNVGSGWT